MQQEMSFVIATGVHTGIFVGLLALIWALFNKILWNDKKKIQISIFLDLLFKLDCICIFNHNYKFLHSIIFSLNQKAALL
jgi:hypothetical protein